MESVSTAPRAGETETLEKLRKKSRWLLGHASNVTSQRGEDGIISKSLEMLPERTGWCIEFGAWDGRKYSNTYNLVTAANYRGVFIEPDHVRFRELQQTHDGKKHILLNAFVGFNEKDCLDAILRDTSVPLDADLLSIDIDGNDYHAWAAIRSYHPKLVIIEYNPTIANAVHFIQERREVVQQGSSAASLIDLGHSKGYELVAVTPLNLLFVDSRYYPLFNISDNSLTVMRDDAEIPHIFVGYDGKVFLSQSDKIGKITLPWHQITLRESKVQALPKCLQKYPDNYTRFERSIVRCYLAFRNPKTLLENNYTRFERFIVRCYLAFRNPKTLPEKCLRALGRMRRSS
jgi:hypothetical protein